MAAPPRRSRRPPACSTASITTAYFAPESDTANPWVQVEKKILQQYAPTLYAKSGLDGNDQYGVALAYTFVQALQTAGKNLTRQGLIAAIAKDGKNFVTPGFVPLSYSSSVHFGFEGEEVVKLEQLGPAGRDAHGQLDRRRAGQPGRGDQPGIRVDKEVHRGYVDPAQELRLTLLEDRRRRWRRFASVTGRPGRTGADGDRADALGMLPGEQHRLGEPTW